jgi:RNA-directed DNA polymerase
MPFSIADKKAWGKKRGWVCSRCNKRWSDGWLMEFHHIIPSSLGGTDTEDNAELLCVGCHLTRHMDILHTAQISANLIRSRLKRTSGRWK